MACGIPVVVSPYGMNLEILECRCVGLGAVNHDQWVSSINWLLDNPADAYKMGLNGKSVVDQKYSLEKLSIDLGNFCTKITLESSKVYEKLS
jgi:glycosyltransferase involved in cell wall biosynthesis